MATLGAWFAGTFAALWLGSVAAAVTGFTMSLTALTAVLVLVVVLIVIAIAFHSRRAAAAMFFAPAFVGGIILLTTVYAPSL